MKLKTDWWVIIRANKKSMLQKIFPFLMRCFLSAVSPSASRFPSCAPSWRRSRVFAQLHRLWRRRRNRKRKFRKGSALLFWVCITTKNKTVVLEPAMNLVCLPIQRGRSTTETEKTGFAEKETANWGQKGSNICEISRFFLCTLSLVPLCLSVH